MKLATVKCRVNHTSYNSFCLYDSDGREAYIPFKFLAAEKHDDEGFIYEVTIPLWLAIDRKINYQEK